MYLLVCVFGLVRKSVDHRDQHDAYEECCEAENDDEVSSRSE